MNKYFGYKTAHIALAFIISQNLIRGSFKVSYKSMIKRQNLKVYILFIDFQPTDATEIVSIYANS